MGVHAVRCTGLATGTAGVGDAGASRERRRLSIDGPACGLEVLFQLLVFPTQPLAFRFRPAQVLAQALVLAAQLLDRLLGIARRVVRRVSDRPYMPDLSPVEKYKELMATI